MRILFISNDLIAGNLAHLLRKEGNQVKLYIHEEGRKNNFHNLVDKTLDWKSELGWVGKKGLVAFDDVGFGFFQKKLREEGYAVFGGTEEGDLLEQNRVFGQEIFAKCGMQTLLTRNFIGITDAIRFVKRNPGPWVVKQNGAINKGINYVGYFNDGRDVLDVLASYQNNQNLKSEVITIQQKAVGIEMAVMRYFNGSDWIGPILVNVEHKKFFPGDLGPMTSEMGTLGWYDENEDNKLFQQTLSRLKPYLQKINYRGVIDINSIVNENGAFPLEITSRSGSPTVHLQTELHISPWSELMEAVATGKQYNLKFKKGFGIVVVVAIPPFPYAKKIEEHSQVGTHIYFDDSTTKEDMEHIHFEEVSWDKKTKRHYISDSRGYILYVTGHGSTVEKARANAYKLVKKIYIPKMLYRNDIGLRFTMHDREHLERWGYLPKKSLLQIF